MPSYVPVGQEDPMSTLCRMVVDTKYEDLPSRVVSYAKRSILDTMAVTIGGSGMEAIPAIVELVRDKGGKPESIIPCYGDRVPASEAGLAIGPMARAMDMGDVHQEASHSSEYTFPALLAATGLKAKITGKEFITAFVVGQEVLIRIGTAFRSVTGVLDGGEHNTPGGHFIFGPVAATGKLVGLSLEELENAQGIARVITQPYDRAMFAQGVLMVRVHHGFICQDAINACLLARRGITGSRQEVLVGKRGYLSLAKWETDPAALTKGLGEEWAMTATMMKSYAACGRTHTAIDGMLALMREHNFEAEDIASIEIDVPSAIWSAVCTPKELKWNPRTVPECQFSLPYVVATVAFDKEVFLSSYTPQAMSRQNVRDLMTRISVREDSSLPLNLDKVRIKATLKDGRIFKRESVYVRGHPKNPFTEQELINKFKRCVPYSAYKLSEEVVDSLIKAILGLEEVDDVVSALLLPLTPK